MLLNAKVIVEVGSGIALLLAFIISMAIANGLILEMRMDIEGDNYRWRWPPPGLHKVSNYYRTKHPGTTKPRQMWLAIIIGYSCFIAFIVVVLASAW